MCERNRSRERKTNQVVNYQTIFTFLGLCVLPLKGEEHGTETHFLVEKNVSTLHVTSDNYINNKDMCVLVPAVLLFEQTITKEKNFKTIIECIRRFHL